jgi:hypothetical protein
MVTTYYPARKNNFHQLELKNESRNETNTEATRIRANAVGMDVDMPESKMPVLRSGEILGRDGGLRRSSHLPEVLDAGENRNREGI